MQKSKKVRVKGCDFDKFEQHCGGFKFFEESTTFWDTKFGGSTILLDNNFG